MKTKSHHSEIIDYFVTKYEEETGTKYIFKSGKDGAIIKRLLKALGHVRLKLVIDELFNTSDKWISETDRSIGILSAKINQLNQAVGYNDRPKTVKRDIKKKTVIQVDPMLRRAK